MNDGCRKLFSLQYGLVKVWRGREDVKAHHFLSERRQLGWARSSSVEGLRRGVGRIEGGG